MREKKAMRNSNGLIGLACGTFALGVAEFSMMAILSPLAHNLSISLPKAGDLISAYAIGVSLGAPLPVFFSRHPLKHILLGLCCVIFAGNVLSASSTTYATLLVSRFIAGLPHGAFFGVAAIVATSLVEPGRRASAVAIMVSGMTAANLFGVPVATWIANAYSWRYTFVIAAIFGALSFIGIKFSIPAGPERPSTGLKRQFMFLRGSAPWLIFAATFLGQGAIYCWYSYMEPILLQIAKIPPQDMKFVMVVAGLGMCIGNLLGGRLADKYHPALVAGGAALIMGPTLALIYFFSAHAWLAVILTFIGAMTLFMLGGPMQYLVVRFSRGGEILGGAGIQIAFNVSNAVAAFIGGLAIQAGYGIASPALIGVPLSLACLLCVGLFYCRFRHVPVR